MKKKLFHIFGIFLLGMLSGIVFQKQFGIWKIKMKFHNMTPISWKRDHTPINSVPKTKLMVALAFGQSNSANFGLGLKKSKERVFNFYHGKLYKAEDPMLGADALGASTWPRLGDLLIASDHYKNIVFATIGISGSTISRWEPDGDLHPLLLSTLQSIKESGLTITHLLWHQGESDAAINTSKAAYQKSFRKMIKAIHEQGTTAPVYISIATRYKDHPKNQTIRSAQIELAQKDDSFFQGPDSDQLGDNFRKDGTHFTSEGLDHLAQLWFNQLIISHDKPKRF